MPCDICGEAHATDGHADAMRAAARAGKPSFIVRVVSEARYRVWADDSAKAEDTVYWRRSSQREYPDVEDLGTQPVRMIVEAT